VKPPAELTAADLMTRDVFTVRTRDSVHHVAKLLNERRISGAPVLDDRGRLVGIISKTDLVRAWGKALSSAVEDFFEMPGDESFDPEDQPIGQIVDLMHRGLVTVGPEAAASELAKLMLERRIHRVLVTRGDELLGIVSSLDLLKTIAPENSPS
jgi:CBS domain-containing protein